MCTVPPGHPEKPQGEQGRKLLERMNGGAHEELATWALDLLAPESLPAVDKTGRMLDVGCGGGANLRRLMERVGEARVTGIDYSPVSVALSREVNADAIGEGRCEVLEGDVGTLPFGDGQFGVVTAFETVYFWPHVDVALREIRRVLASGGRLLIANDDGTQPAAHAIAQQIDGMSVYTADELKKLLLEAGFLSVEVFHDETTHQMALVAEKG